MKWSCIISSVLAVVLILLAGGCGTAQRFDMVAPITTEATTVTTTETTTTEAPTTAEAATALPTIAPGVALRQRVLDMDDKANAELKRRLEENSTKKRLTECPMGNGKTVVDDHAGLFLRDDKTGKETLLLEAKWDDPYEEHNESPYVAHKLDDRYFLYIIQGWEWHAGAGIYDTKRMKAIPIEKPPEKIISMYSFYRPTHSDMLYLTTSDYEVSAFAVYGIDLSKLDKAMALPIGENLLKDVSEAQSEELQSDCHYAAFSSDGRYCAVLNSYALTNGVAAVFDLHKKAFIFQIEKPVSMKEYFRAAFDDNNALYVYGVTNQSVLAREVLEIKFPKK